MDNNEINNESLFQIDWAANDRAVFLNSIPKAQPIRKKWLAPGLPVTGLIGTDVSAMDRRSVKAQLAGRGDWRAAWWNLNEKLYRLVAPNASTETVMYAFHRRHQALTIAYLKALRNYRDVISTFYHHGWLHGIPHVVRVLFQRNAKEH